MRKPWPDTPVSRTSPLCIVRGRDTATKRASREAGPSPQLETGCYFFSFSSFGFTVAGSGAALNSSLICAAVRSAGVPPVGILVTTSAHLKEVKVMALDDPDLEPSWAEIGEI